MLRVGGMMIFPANQMEADVYNNGVFDDSDPYSDYWDWQELNYDPDGPYYLDDPDPSDYDGPEDYDIDLWDKDAETNTLWIDYTKEDAFEDRFNTWKEYEEVYPDWDDW